MRRSLEKREENQKILKKMAEKLPSENGKVKNSEDSPLIFTEKLLDADFDEVYRQYPLNEDTSCGLGFVQGKCLQM